MKDVLTVCKLVECWDEKMAGDLVAGRVALKVDEKVGLKDVQMAAVLVAQMDLKMADETD